METVCVLCAVRVELLYIVLGEIQGSEAEYVNRIVGCEEADHKVLELVWNK
jgi:hypothetical protein